MEREVEVDREREGGGEREVGVEVEVLKCSPNGAFLNRRFSFSC
jgi:hypothetical protein